MDTYVAPHTPIDLDEDLDPFSGDRDLDDDREYDEAWWIASSATSYQQSYRRSPTRRVFQLYELTGPDIDDAHQRGQHASGTWRDYTSPGPRPWDDASAGVEAWTTKYLRMALQETVHECLEWLRIHGRPWLNPPQPPTRRGHPRSRRRPLRHLRRAPLLRRYTDSADHRPGRDSGFHRRRQGRVPAVLPPLPRAP